MWGRRVGTKGQLLVSGETRGHREPSLCSWVVSVLWLRWWHGRGSGGDSTHWLTFDRTEEVVRMCGEVDLHVPLSACRCLEWAAAFVRLCGIPPLLARLFSPSCLIFISCILMDSSHLSFQSLLACLGDCLLWAWSVFPGYVAQWFCSSLPVWLCTFACSSDCLSVYLTLAGNSLEFNLCLESCVWAHLPRISGKACQSVGLCVLDYCNGPVCRSHYIGNAFWCCELYEYTVYVVAVGDIENVTVLN